MASFLLILPEEILGVGALVLMLVAACGGRRRAGARHWLAVALLVAATVAFGPPSQRRRRAFGGLFVADAFAAFAKSSSSRPPPSRCWWRWLVRPRRDYRAEYPVLILFSALGMAMMVSASDLLTLYVGLELQSLAAYVLASFQRTDARSAEAGLKYFVLGALACGILLYGISLLYGFTGTTSFDGIAAALAREGASRGELFGLVFVLAGSPSRSRRCRSTCGRPTSTKARRPRSPPSSPRRPRSRRCLLDRVWSRRWARRPRAGGRSSSSWRSPRPSSAASPRSARATSSGCSPTARSTMSASLWSASPPAAPRARRSVLFYMAVYIVMTLGAFLFVLRMRDADGQPVERSPAWPACRGPGPACAGDGDLHVQPRRHPAVVRLLAQVHGVQRRGRGRAHCRSPRRHRAPRRRLLLHQDRQDDVFRRARRQRCRGRRRSKAR